MLAPACIPVTEGKKIAKTAIKLYSCPSVTLYCGCQFCAQIVARKDKTIYFKLEKDI